MSDKIKRKYGKWTADDMTCALKEYNENKLGFNECCRKYGIPKPTFSRHSKGLVKRGLQRTSSGKLVGSGVNG